MRLPGGRGNFPFPRVQHCLRRGVPQACSAAPGHHAVPRARQHRVQVRCCPPASGCVRVAAQVRVYRRCSNVWHGPLHEPRWRGVLWHPDQWPPKPPTTSVPPPPAWMDNLLCPPPPPSRAVSHRALLRTPRRRLQYLLGIHPLIGMVTLAPHVSRVLSSRLNGAHVSGGQAPIRCTTRCRRCLRPDRLRLCISHPRRSTGWCRPCRPPATTPAGKALRCRASEWASPPLPLLRSTWGSHLSDRLKAGWRTAVSTTTMSWGWGCAVLCWGAGA